MASITIKEIAKICGVSDGTVDRAINNRPGISPNTKKKILEVAKEFNYKPDPIAQSLAKGRTMSIGLLCFDLSNNFIANLVDTVESIAKENDYYIDLVLSHGNVKSEREGIEYLLERKVAGIIIFPVGYGEEYVSYIENLGVPVVSIYNRISESVPYIGINARAAMKAAVEYVAKQSYERVVLVNSTITDKIRNNVNVYTLWERQKGYLDGIDTYGLNNGKPIIVEGLDFPEIDRLVETQNGSKTVFLCICDFYALEILNHFKAKKISVPDQVGIMGFDNVETLKYVSPQITTISYDVDTMAKSAISVLINMIEERADETVTYNDVTCNIEYGQSL